ncbi:MAG TPA: class I SAM-dependent rRNA methyltransferase [Burkholderiaceae bacterium]|nr:class I SAM-dependent rRNA methyltransferase [Burkholderiaceae bacterium]
MAIPELQLKVRVRGRHPWFYRKMVVKPAQPLPAGCVARVVDRDGRMLGSGFFNPRTELALRMFADRAVEDPAAHFVQTLAGAVALREELLDLPAATNAWRLVHGEGDGCPGLLLDRLGDVFVAQVHSLGMLNQMEPLGEWLRARVRGCRLLLQQDEDAVRREGMERLPRPQPLPVEVHEHGIRYAVQAGGGHKTGFFADQRDNRRLVQTLARGRRVLDLCCNAGGFALNAAAGGARSVLAVDLDEAMAAATAANAQQNRLRVETRHADAFDVLRELRGGEHDLLVLDPPKWVHGRDEFTAGIARYRDLNRLALQKVASGGLIVTCSCSGSVSEDSFLRMLQDAAADAGVQARVLHLRGAGADHPVALQCPETRYLKVVVLQVER